MGQRVFLAVFAFVLFLCLNESLVSTQTQPTCNSLTAAFRNDERLYLLFGKSFIIFNHEKKAIKKKGPVSKLFKYFPDVPIDAVFRSLTNPKYLMVFSGNKYYKIVKGRKVSGVKPVRRLFRRIRRLRNGLDAAAAVGKRTFYFKGCHVVMKAIGKRARTLHLKRRIGLPCDMDAAWPLGDQIILVKGPVSWIFNPLTYKKRPFCFYC